MVFFFFFQAEDGIRDPLVTGVQTCALRSTYSDPSEPAANPPGKESSPTTVMGALYVDRKSVGEGKSVGLCGRRIIKKKKKKKTGGMGGGGRNKKIEEKGIEWKKMV